MDRHVIKGRGANRGKYLCWARMAPDVKPMEDGFVWLPEQRKAARWADPRYSGRTWATDRARLHNGYFVKLVGAAPIDATVIRELQTYIAGHAAGATEELPCYWFGDDFHDAGKDFCRDCAEEVVDQKYAANSKRFEELYGDECDGAEERYRAAIDGGFDTDHDSPPYCQTCGARLSGYLTEYGADEEIEALTDYAAPAFDHAAGWAALERAIINLSDDDPRWPKIAKVVDVARGAERENAERLVALAKTPGMTEERVGFLSLLAARAEQKASEPSFPLWRTMLRYEKLSFDRRYHPTRLIRRVERRLIREAKRFAACLGFGCHYSCGTFIIRAPYGEYHWPFIVQIQQYRLWQPTAFQEGRAYMLDPCPSGDPEWPHHRDANPYPEGSIEHSQWDCGYISASAPRAAA